MQIARPLTVGLVSASTVAYEILLVRIFGIEYFHHFAYMAIGVAMLGVGASGTFLALARPPDDRAERWFIGSAALTAFALLASAIMTQQISLDVAQLPWDPRQWIRLAVVYLWLAAPFAVGALTILLGLSLEARSAGRLYGASFVGAGIGAGLAVAVLWLIFPRRALAVPALIASLGGLSALAAGRARRGLGGKLVVVAAVALSLGALLAPPWRISITPYKGLPQVEALPDARRVAEHASPVGWVVAVQAPSFHHAPGLSLAYRGEFPKQTALFVDGDLVGALSVDPSPAAGRIFDWLPSTAPYVGGGRASVLVLAAGGDGEVRTAVRHGAKRVRVVELHPEVARLCATAFAADPNVDVEWVIGDARRFAESSRERFDLITIGPGSGFGTSAAGVHALNEDFLHTVEAYVRYLGLLDQDGVLSITRWLTVPPRAGPRVIFTAAEALRRVSPDDMIDKLIVVRSWSTTTVLVKPAGFRSEEIHALMSWSRARRFDLDWYPGIEAPASGFNFIDEPILYRAAAASTTGAAAVDRFIAAYPFDVAPVDDARPYPHHFLRLRSSIAFLGGGLGGALPFAEWGQVALIATLVQSLVLGALLLLPPVAWRAHGVATGRGRVLGYFACIGLAYMAAEIAAIEQLSLLLGHPVYAVAAVLVALLVFSGVGSAWSDGREPRLAGWTAATLAAVLALYSLGLIGVAQALQPTPLAVRVVAAVLVLAPLAALMGMPFPLGLRRMAGDRETTAWAWAANGFASVAAAPAAALVSLEAGSRVLLLIAALAYAGAAAAAGAGPVGSRSTARSPAPT